MANMQNPFVLKSKERLLRLFRGAVSRFPLPMGFSILLTLLLIHIGIIDFNYGDHTEIYHTIFFYLGCAIPLSLGLRLWSEEQTDRRRRIGVQIAAHTLLLAETLHYGFRQGENWMEFTIALFAMGVALICLLVFASFGKEKDDISAWNFTFRSIGSLAVALLIGHVMWGGLSLLLLSVNTLFGVFISGTCYYYLYVVCGELLSLTLFFGLLPHGTEKHDRQPLAWSFFNKVTRYLFLPLTLAYLVVLYVYALRILILWELPNGWCSLPVSILMAGCLGLELCLYPVRKGEGRHFDNQVAHWLPLLILPLLLLMTVGIGKRLLDYGLTVNRFYLLTLNLWFYAVCIGLFRTHARRLRWVPISFALLFLATSVLPVNYTTLTRRILTHQVKNVLEHTLPHGVQPPLDETQYGTWLKGLPKEEARSMNDKLSYLYSEFGTEAVNPFIEDNTAYVLHRYRPDAAPHGSYIRDASLGEGEVILLPAGYTRLTAISNLAKTLPAQQLEAAHLAVSLDEYGLPEDTVYIRLQDFEQELETGRLTSPVNCTCNSRDTRFLLTRFFCNTYSPEHVTVNISGYLLKR